MTNEEQRRLGIEECRARVVHETKHLSNIFRREGKPEIAIALDTLAQRIASMDIEGTR